MKLLALDGNSIINRAFYGIKLLTTKNGIYTNAIFGFLTMLRKLEEEVNPDTVAIAFDLPKPTFRHEIYDKYKANRKGMPDELAAQLPTLKQLLKYLGYQLVECEGFEADDILGTLAKACETNKDECIIATGDRDSFQLISNRVSVRLMSTKFGKAQSVLYDESEIQNVYGVTPEELIYVKAIQGDSSDNIPGIKGIGEKGALALIKAYHSLDNIYKDLDTLDVKPNIRAKLKEGKESAYLSLKLGEINTAVPIDIDLNNYKIKEIDFENAAKMMVDLEFFSLLDKFGLKDTKKLNEDNDNKKSENIKYDLIKDLELLKGKLTNNDKVYFSFQVDSQKKLEAMAFNIDKEILVLESCRDISDINNFFKYIFSNNTYFITHNLKLFLNVIQEYDFDIKNIKFDTMLAAYLLNPDSKDYSIERLCNEYGIHMPNLNKISYADLIRDIFVLPKLSATLLDNIEKNDQVNLLSEIELPLSEVLANMENLGFKIDTAGIKNFGEELNKKISAIENDIYDNVGYEFNINSPKQLAVALFEELGLKGGKKTKTGYSTSAEVLEKLRFEHPVVELVLEYRTLAKLKSTYCDGLVKQVSSDGRVRSHFKQTETRTGRISSTEPNLQNIPVKTDIGKNLRKFFVAKDGYVLIDADYSQIELRVLAHMANDENMIAAFKHSDDIHKITASQVFNMPVDMVSPIMRNRAKAVNFGIVYGISAFSLSQDIGVSVKEAKDYIDGYLKHYKGVAAYMEDIVDSAKENGYVETMFKRRRYLPELMSSNFNLRSFGKRVAMNMPIQGTAADIIKLAMINVSNRLKNEKLNSKLILQVHDELIVEAPEEEITLVKNILLEEMQNCVNLKVPLTVDIGIGKRWLEAKD